MSTYANVNLSAKAEEAIGMIVNAYIHLPSSPAVDQYQLMPTPT